MGSRNSEKEAFEAAYPATRSFRPQSRADGGGLKDSIWATSPVPNTPLITSPTITPTTASHAGDVARPVSQALAGRPSTLTRSTHPTSTVVTRVDAIATKSTPPWQTPSAFNASLVKKTSISSSQPINPPVISDRPKKPVASLYRKTDPSGDDFEIVGHVDAEEEFDVVDNQGPSATNGAAKYAFRTGWEDDE